LHSPSRPTGFHSKTTIEGGPTQILLKTCTACAGNCLDRFTIVSANNPAQQSSFARFWHL
jgi:hypothetical protein